MNSSREPNPAFDAEAARSERPGETCAYSEHLRILQGSPLFGDAPPEALKLLAYLAQAQTYAPGQTLALQGEDATALYHLREGRATAERRVENQTVPVRELGPGDCFGGPPLAVGATCLYTVRAAAPLVTLTLTGEALAKACDSFPALRPALLAALVRQALAWEDDFIRRRPDAFQALGEEFGAGL